MTSSGLQKSFLYENIAASISDLIKKGTYRTGDRIPSIRQMSKQQQVSISTVQQAYRMLEDQGVIEAQPQSGYYVRIPENDRLPEPEPLSSGPDPSHVSLRELVVIIMRDTLNTDLTQLGAMVANPEYLPVTRLNRIIARLTRETGGKLHKCVIPPGLEELRVQIARRSLNCGCHFSPDDIMVTSGATEAIDMCLQTVCNPGDIVAIESPMYFGTLQSLEMHSLRALEIPTHQRQGISLAALKSAIEHNPVKAVLAIPNFNNPLGSCMPDDKKKELVEMLAKCGIPLIENDIFGEIYYTDQRPRTAKSYDKHGLVLLCSSFSKDISSGLRVGWVAPGQYKAAVEWHKFTANAATPTITQMALAEFLESGGYAHHLRRIRREYARNINLLSQAVSRCFPPETRITRPSGGFVLWLQLPGNIDALELYKRALQNGITIAPGHLFSATGQYTDYIRLSAAAWTYPIERAVEKLGEISGEMVKSRPPT